MVTFAISRSNQGLGFTACVEGEDVGCKVNAAEFRPVGKIVTDLAKTFGDAVNDARVNGVDITAPASKLMLTPKF